MRFATVGFVTLALVASGCLGGQDPSPAAADETADALDTLSWHELGSLVFNTTHDHTDREVHTEVERGLGLVSRSTFSDDGLSRGEYIEADVQDDVIAVGIVTGPGSTMDVVLLDATALPALKILGEAHEPNAYGDVKLDPSVPLMYIPFASNEAFAIWDVSDPADPVRLGDAPGPGCHMLHPIRVAGAPHVWCAADTGPTAYRIVRTPDGATGVPVGDAVPQSDPETTRYLDYYQELTPLGPALLVSPHDMTAQPDPVTGDPVLVTAHELQGIRVFDISVPTAPVELGAWRGDGMSEPLERIHTVGLVEIDDRRIAIGTTETFTSVEPAMYIVDFTDYANPEFLTRWVPPGIEHDDTLTYSLHNFQVVEDRLYLTNFHAGLWVLDVSDPATPEPVALRVPVWDTEYPRPGEQSLPGVFVAMNWYWDVLVVDGYVLATDMSAGVEVLHVDGDPAGDPDWDGFT